MKVFVTRILDKNNDTIESKAFSSEDKMWNWLTEYATEQLKQTAWEIGDTPLHNFFLSGEFDETFHNEVLEVDS